jgi:hypothetical protein
MRIHSSRVGKVDAKQLVAILALLEVPFSSTNRHTHSSKPGPVLAQNKRRKGPAAPKGPGETGKSKKV